MAPGDTSTPFTLTYNACLIIRQKNRSNYRKKKQYSEEEKIYAPWAPTLTRLPTTPHIAPIPGDYFFFLEREQRHQPIITSGACLGHASNDRIWVLIFCIRLSLRTHFEGSHQRLYARLFSHLMCKHVLLVK